MITFSADGKDYKLEVTPATIRQMSKSGVNFAKIGENLIAPEILWKGMFIAHHNTVPDAKRMEIYNSLEREMDGESVEYDEDGKPVDALIIAIAEEYTDAIEKMKRGQGNVAWKRS